MRTLYSSASLSKEKARVLVVGSGRMGTIRATLVRANLRLELVGIVDTHLASAQSLSERLGVRKMNCYNEIPMLKNFNEYFS
jgi:predicted dehydrogenase